jgi:hypothetical protein
MKERTFKQLLELRDRVNAIVAELDQATHPMCVAEYLQDHRRPVVASLADPSPPLA